MKKRRNATLIPLLIALLNLASIVHSQETLHYDLKPMYSPDDPAFLRDLAGRLESSKRASKLSLLNKTQELCVYIFSHDSTIRIEVFAERENTKHAIPIAYWMEFSICGYPSLNAAENYAVAFKVPELLERNYSSAWRYLLFRTSWSNFDARIMTDSPWIMVTGWGLQGRIQEPYRDSPVGRLLSETLLLVRAYALTGEINPATLETSNQRLMTILEAVEPVDGRWSIEVSDPYVRGRGDAEVPRLDLSEFRKIGLGE